MLREINDVEALYYCSEDEGDFRNKACWASKDCRGIREL